MKRIAFLIVFVAGVAIVGSGCPPFFFYSDAEAPILHYLASTSTDNRLNVSKYTVPGLLNQGAMKDGETLCFYANLIDNSYRLLVWDPDVPGYINIADSEAAADNAIAAIKEEKYLDIRPYRNINAIDMEWQGRTTKTPALCLDLTDIMTDTDRGEETIFQFSLDQEAAADGHTVWATSAGGYEMEQPRYFYVRQAKYGDNTSPQVASINFTCNVANRKPDDFEPSVTFTKPMGQLIVGLVDANSVPIVLTNSMRNDGTSSYEYVYTLSDNVTLNAGGTYTFFVIHDANAATDYFDADMAFSQDLSGNTIDESSAGEFNGPADMNQMLGGGATGVDVLYQCFYVAL